MATSGVTYHSFLVNFHAINDKMLTDIFFPDLGCFVVVKYHLRQIDGGKLVAVKYSIDQLWVSMITTNFTAVCGLLKAGENCNPMLCCEYRSVIGFHETLLGFCKNICSNLTCLQPFPCCFFPILSGSVSVFVVL